MPFSSIGPTSSSLAEGSARLASWEWFASTDELRWISGQTEIYARPSHELNTSSAWSAIVHPDDRKRLVAAATRAVKSGSSFVELFRVTGKDGNLLWIVGYGRVEGWGSESLRLIGLNMDVTE